MASYMGSSRTKRKRKWNMKWKQGLCVGLQGFLKSRLVFFFGGGGGGGEGGRRGSGLGV